jgi:murein DD-endopeptidase MepM/ murein hydrolase activator NlpD
VNCDDARGHNQVGLLCDPQDANRVNFQASGYRPIEKKDKYIEVFNRLYSESDLTSILDKVVENSSKASTPAWDYHDEKQANNPLTKSFLESRKTATLNDISPNATDFFDGKTQFLSLMLGKDPAMAAGMNSFAVSEDDVVRALKGGGYGYIAGPHKQLISNMMMALYLLDSEGGGGGISCNPGAKKGGGSGIAALWGGQGKMRYWGFGEYSDNGLYGYGVNYGLNGVQHTAVDFFLDPYAPAYSPINGTVVCANNQEGCSGANDYSKQVPGGQYYSDTCAASNDPSRGGGAGSVIIVNDKDEKIVIGHLAESVVKNGQQISIGDQVGTTGCMFGWHVHVEYHVPEQAPDLPYGIRYVDVIEAVGGTKETDESGTTWVY